MDNKESISKQTDEAEQVLESSERKGNVLKLLTFRRIML
jgi:hypothetical protein